MRNPFKIVGPAKISFRGLHLQCRLTRPIIRPIMVGGAMA
jgi:hypothetical protein